MSPAPLFDRALIDLRRRRAVADPAAADARFLLASVAEELAERLALVDRRFPLAVELAGHSGEMAGRLARSGQVDRVLRIERHPAFLGPAFLGPALQDPSLPGEADFALVADEEALPLRDDCADLIVSPLSLHLTNDTPGVILQARRALKPDGLFLAALLGGESLGELRTSLLAAEAEVSGGVSPRVPPFVDIRDAGALLQRAGLALPVTDQDRLTVRYASMFELMRDLRRMGMANAMTERSRRPSRKTMFLRAAEIYLERFSDPDGRIRATFDVVYLSGWKPHESQQQPLRPGSAKHSLAAALNDRTDAPGR